MPSNVGVTDLLWPRLGWLISRPRLNCCYSNRWIRSWGEGGHVFDVRIQHFHVLIFIAWDEHLVSLPGHAMDRSVEGWHRASLCPVPSGLVSRLLDFHHRCQLKLKMKKGQLLRRGRSGRLIFMWIEQAIIMRAVVTNNKTKRIIMCIVELDCMNQATLGLGLACCPNRLWAIFVRSLPKASIFKFLYR